jgi:hypothetical protein
LGEENVTANISLPFSTVSPQTYTNAHCGDAQVYALRDPSVVLGPIVSGSSLDSVSVYYAEAGPTNQADCETSSTGLLVYTDMGQGSSHWYFLGDGGVNGYWSNNACYHTPSVISIPSHTFGGTFNGPQPWQYKVFATARHADNTTAQMVVQSGPCGQIGQLACANALCDAGTIVGGSSSGETMCAAVEQFTMSVPLLQAGSVDANESMTLSNTGAWTFSGHAHNHAVVGVNYTLGTAAPEAYNGFQFGAVHSGVLHGIDVGSRDDNFTERGTDSRILRNWTAIKADATSPGWNVHLHESTSAWLAGEDALIGLGLATAATAALLFFTDPATTCDSPTIVRDPDGTGVQVMTTCHK